MYESDARVQAAILNLRTPIMSSTREHYAIDLLYPNKWGVSLWNRVSILSTIIIMKVPDLTAIKHDVIQQNWQYNNYFNNKIFSQ